MAYIDDQQTQLANTAYIRETMAKPILEKEEELELARQWRDHSNEKALHKLTQAYIRLVVAQAAKFKHYNLPMGDLIQEGNIGLMEAAKRFDPERDLRFSTYATWWIKASLQDYVLRNWSIVRTGTTAAQKSLFFNLRRLRARIENKAEDSSDYMSFETKQKIAKELNVRQQDVDHMEQCMFSPDHSLNAPIGKEDGQTTEWQSTLEDDRPTPEEIVIGTKTAQDRSQWLQNALENLPERERHIIAQRRLNDETVTLEELGKELGVSKERVRQLELRAMDKLKTSIIEQSENDDLVYLSA